MLLTFSGEGIVAPPSGVTLASRNNCEELSPSYREALLPSTLRASGF
ncbi:MAG: hypothetical protein M3O31_15830 [Acidobacteriota bacterium]|nr:hypothetical protein [Acidobacteriota bacterium]